MHDLKAGPHRKLADAAAARITDPAFSTDGQWVEARRRTVVRRTGNLVQAAGGDAAAELRIDGGDAEGQGPCARSGKRAALAAGQRAARRPRLDRADAGREGVACGGADGVRGRWRGGVGIHASRILRARSGACPGQKIPDQGS